MYTDEGSAVADLDKGALGAGYRSKEAYSVVTEWMCGVLFTRGAMPQHRGKRCTTDFDPRVHVSFQVLGRDNQGNSGGLETSRIYLCAQRRLERRTESVCESLQLRPARRLCRWVLVVEKE